MAFGWSGEVLDESPDATEKDAPSQGTCVGTPSFELHSLCGWSGHHSLVICIQHPRGSEALSNTERQQVHIYGPGESSRSQFVRHADSNESIYCRKDKRNRGCRIVPMTESAIGSMSRHDCLGNSRTQRLECRQTKKPRKLHLVVDHGEQQQTDCQSHQSLSAKSELHSRGLSHKTRDKDQRTVEDAISCQACNGDSHRDRQQKDGSCHVWNNENCTAGQQCDQTSCHYSNPEVHVSFHLPSFFQWTE